MLKKMLSAALCLLLYSCTGSQFDPQFTLIDKPFRLEHTIDSLNGFLGDRYRLTPLEFSDESMIGIINKVVKRNEYYYVMTGDYTGGTEIIVYDQVGCYSSKMSRRGRGPGEYMTIGDFEVHPGENGTELWICSLDRIMIYGAPDWNLIREMRLPFMINKFRRLPDNTLLLMTAQNDESLTLIDMDGNVLNMFLPKILPFLNARPVQFVPYGNSVLFQLGNSNQFVSYDWKMKEFEIGQFVGNNYFLSANRLADIYEQVGEDYPAEIKNETYVRALRQHNNKLFLEIYDAGDRYLLAYDIDRKTFKCCKFFPDQAIPNNINGTNDVGFISYMIYGDSDDSLLMMLEQETVDLSQNNNPFILEYF